ncbi:MAG TPA: hypothetical protein VHA73_16135 [Acidimicrobiales bacterium]|jgi:hypothetical protein|nr:hypothetical protein [Acidimicrobiales bacterium]
MTVLAVLVAAADDVPQDPWPFVIVGYVIMGLGLIAVAVQTVVRGRRLARRVPAGQRRWLEVRAAEVARRDAAPAPAAATGAPPADAPEATGAK